MVERHLSANQNYIKQCIKVNNIVSHSLWKYVLEPSQKNIQSVSGMLQHDNQPEVFESEDSSTSSDI